MGTDVTIGAKLTADASEAIQSVKSFKQQLKEAQNEVQIISDKFGETSKQAQAAAKKAAELADKIGDAKKLTDAFNPDQKFRALSQSLTGVLGGFTALTGAMGLLGVNSDSVQKTLLKVQSAMALSQGLNQLQESINSFRTLASVISSKVVAAFSTLKGAIISTGIGALVVGVGILISKIVSWTSATESNKEAQERLNKALEAQNKIKEEALQSIDYATRKAILEAKIAGKSQDEISKIELKGFQTRSEAIIDNLWVLAGKLNKLRKDDIEGRKKVNEEIRKLEAESLKEIQNEELFKLQTHLDKINRLKGGGAATKEDKRRVGLGWDITGKQDKISLTPELTPEEKEAQRVHNFLVGLFDARTDRIKKYNDETKRLAAERSATDRAEFEAKMAMADATANILTGLSGLIGEQTAAGKVFAVAAATINTYASIAKTLNAFAGVPVPGYAIAQAIATGIFGLVQVKKILATPVPGGNGGGGGASVSAPSAQLPQATQTLLNQNQLNQIGNAASRAFVVESDIQNNSERVRRLNRAARL